MRSSVGAKVEATLEAGFAPSWVAERRGRVATGAAWEDVSGAPGRRGGVVVRARTSGVVPALEGRGGAAKVRPKSRLREPFVVEQDGLREIGREDWVVEVAVGRERGCGGQRALAGRGGGW